MIEEARNVSVNLHGEHGRFKQTIWNGWSWNWLEAKCHWKKLEKIFSEPDYPVLDLNWAKHVSRFGQNMIFIVSRFVMIQLFFAAKWILISEVTFESGQFFSWASNKTSRFQALPTSNISRLRNLRNALRAIILFSRPSHVTISRRTRSNMTVVFINSCDSSLNIMWVFMPPPPPPNPHFFYENW